MTDRPRNFDQFHSTPKRDGPFVYMGGTTIGCGDHPTAFKRHRWVKYEAPLRGHYCGRCGLVKE